MLIHSFILHFGVTYSERQKATENGESEARRVTCRARAGNKPWKDTAVHTWDVCPEKSNQELEVKGPIFSKKLFTSVF